MARSGDPVCYDVKWMVARFGSVASLVISITRTSPYHRRCHDQQTGPVRSHRFVLQCRGSTPTPITVRRVTGYAGHDDEHDGDSQRAEESGIQ